MKIRCASILCSHTFTYSFTTAFTLNIYYLVRFQISQEAVGKPSFYFQSDCNLMIRWLESKTDVNWLNKSIAIWRKKAEKQFNNHLMLFKKLGRKALRGSPGLPASSLAEDRRLSCFQSSAMSRAQASHPWPKRGPSVALSRVLPLQGQFSCTEGIQQAFHPTS